MELVTDSIQTKTSWPVVRTKENNVITINSLWLHTKLFKTEVKACIKQTSKFKARCVVVSLNFHLQALFLPIKHKHSLI
jgi:hypothetical protein